VYKISKVKQRPRHNKRAVESNEEEECSHWDAVEARIRLVSLSAVLPGSRTGPLSCRGRERGTLPLFGPLNSTERKKRVLTGALHVAPAVMLKIPPFPF
jgi:hypothetical protein